MILELALAFSLMLEAAKLSQLAPITKEEMPTITQLSQVELANRICGENWDPKKHCERYMAAYWPDTNELVYADAIKLETDFGKSMIAHEMVHVLQKKKHGSVVRSCQELVDMEKEAYIVQDHYMYIHGHYDTHMRDMVRNLVCPPITEVNK